MAATIGKTVGGNIQDAHDLWPVHHQPGKGRARRGDQVKDSCRGIAVAGRLEQLVRLHTQRGIGARLVTLHEVYLIEGSPATSNRVAAVGHHDWPHPAGDGKGRGRQFRRPLKRCCWTHPGVAAIRQAHCLVSSNGRIPGSTRACAWHAASRSRLQVLRVTAFHPRR